jgi:hypothetical protein
MLPVTSALHLRFHVGWVAFNAIAMLVGLPVGLLGAATLLNAILASVPSEYAIPLSAAFAGLLHGVVYGFLQWRRLAAWGVKWMRWIPLSAMGWSLACVALAAMAPLLPLLPQAASLPGWLAAGAVGLAIGLFVGASQSVAVSKVSRPSAWVAANALGLALGGALLVFLASAVPYGQGPGEGILQALTVLVLLPLPGVSVGLFTARSLSVTAKRHVDGERLGAG